MWRPRRAIRERPLLSVQKSKVKSNSEAVVKGQPPLSLSHTSRGLRRTSRLDERCVAPLDRRRADGTWSGSKSRPEAVANIETCRQHFHEVLLARVDASSTAV